MTSIGSLVGRQLSVVCRAMSPVPGNLFGSHDRHQRGGRRQEQSSTGRVVVAGLQCTEGRPNRRPSGCEGSIREALAAGEGRIAQGQSAKVNKSTLEKR